MRTLHRILPRRTPSRRPFVKTTVASASNGALEKRAGTGVPYELPAVDDDTPARDDGIGDAGHFASLVRVVVHTHVQRLRAQRRLLFRVEDDDVGVGAWGNRTLAREQAEDLRRRRRRQL